jgi:predicted chitinase
MRAYEFIIEAEASDDELEKRYGKFDPEDKPMMPTTRIGGAPAPTLWTAYEAIENILGKNRVTDNDDDIEPGMYYVYQSNESPMFKDTEESGTGGSINIPNLDSKAARDVAMAAHEAYHAYVHDKTKGSGRIHANEKIINNLAEKWLRNHLSGSALHVAIETITGSRISYGQDHMPKNGVAKENFADGKNPGRRGLAKRSGVNTKASISDLRKTAKNSTGEKARMAHWMANMKAGRAKHEDVEEGWKDWVAGAAMGAASLGAAGDADASVKHKDLSKPAIHQSVKKKEIKPIAPPAASKKELAKSVTGNSHEVYLKKAAEKAGIEGQELIAFLSQCAHETLDFKHMKEIGGSLDFRKYDPKYAPKKAKALGNTKPGDGAKYKGRGYIQLTGKYNYKKAGEALGLPLEQKPELLEKPEIAAKAAVWYWKNRVATKVDNFKDTTGVTKTINPGMKHLDQRKDKQKAFQVAMR